MIREPRTRLKWHGHEIAFRLTPYYAGGGTRIELLDRRTWEPLCTATVEYIAGVRCAKREVLVNDLNECYGLADLLEQAGLVTQTGTIIERYGLRVYLCVLTDGARAVAERHQGRLL